jgi:peptidoglycan hydrolase-like protein with peptidoglycan-binding domain
MAALIEQLFGVVGAAGGEVWQERPLLPEEHSVWVMQKRLEALGLWPAAAPLDGRPSETTREALRRFQRLAGLRPDGDVHDARTRLVLRDQVRAAAQAGRIPPTP